MKGTIERSIGYGALVLAASLSAQAFGQTGPSRLQGPSPTPTEVTGPEVLRKERFRRRAAEAAQKQLEHIADQLREQLLAEVTARKAVEETLARTIERFRLTDQIDEERQRLRNEKAKSLEERRVALETQVLQLSRQLAEEVNKRQKLQEKLKQTAALATKSEFSSEPSLIARLKEMERELKAARWARKLAEAQLRRLQERRGKGNTE